jgi:hypothetical protein
MPFVPVSWFTALLYCLLIICITIQSPSQVCSCREWGHKCCQGKSTPCTYTKMLKKKTGWKEWVVLFDNWGLLSNNALWNFSGKTFSRHLPSIFAIQRYFTVAKLWTAVSWWYCNHTANLNVHWNNVVQQKWGSEVRRKVYQKSAIQCYLRRGLHLYRHSSCCSHKDLVLLSVNYTVSCKNLEQNWCKNLNS